MAKPGGITGVPYDDCPIFTFVPIFPYDIALHSNSTSLPHEHSPSRIKQAVMQGGIEDGRRDYVHTFESLESEIRGIYHGLSFLLSADYETQLTPSYGVI